MNELDLAHFTPDFPREAFRGAVMTALSELTQCEAFVDDAPPDALAETSEPTIRATVRLARVAPGQLTLVAPVELAEQLAARYLPGGTTLADDIIDDVVGEFANVIGGQAKTALKRSPYHFTMTPPSVSRSTPAAAEDDRAADERDALLTLSVELEFGRMFLQVTLPWCPEASVDGA